MVLSCGFSAVIYTKDHMVAGCRDTNRGPAWGRVYQKTTRQQCRVCTNAATPLGRLRLCILPGLALELTEGHQGKQQQGRYEHQLPGRPVELGLHRFDVPAEIDAGFFRGTAKIYEVDCQHVATD